MKIRRNILLNPGPATTSDEVKFAQLVPDICPREEEFSSLLNSICNDLPKIVGAEDSHKAILFGGSGTAGVEALLSSVISDNDKLLIVSNGAYGERMEQLAKIYKLPYESYNLGAGNYPDIQQLAVLLKENAFSHLAMVHHETTTGMLNPLEEIAELCETHNVSLLVDGMSSFGGIDIDFSKIRVSAIVASSNKCIGGMAGLAFIVYDESLLKGKDQTPKNLYLNMDAQVSYFNKTGQLRFTPPVQVTYAFRKALDILKEEGVQARAGSYKRRMDLLYAGLSKLGFRFLLPKEWESGILLTVLEPNNPKFNFTALHDHLYKMGFTIYPGKIAEENSFRLAVMGELMLEDIELFLKELEGFLLNSGITIAYND